MKRKPLSILLVLLAALLALPLRAQVSVVLFTSPAKQFFIDDLWKTTVINTGTTPVNAYVQFQIRTNGTLNILTLTSQPISLITGANRLNASEGTGGKWNYGNVSASSILQSTGKLPYGSYIYGVYVYATATNKLLGSSSQELEVQPMLPPELANPNNKEEVSLQYPVLSWIPPRPIIGLNITYSLRLVALNSNQSSAEGIVQNPPLVNLDNLSSTYITYPATAQELKPGVTYAWQIAASYEGYNLGQTEVWTFTVKPPPPPPTDDIIYPVATKVSDGHFYVTKGVIRFAYNNKANDKKLNYAIKRLNKKVDLKSLPEMDIKPGINKLEIDLRHNTGLNEKEYYALQITDSKGQVYKLMYYYITQ